MVTASEFKRAIDGLSLQLSTLQATSQATLVQATRTNGRVDSLEKEHDALSQRISTVAAEAATKRDVRMAALGASAAMGAIQLVPKLLALVGGK